MNQKKRTWYLLILTLCLSLSLGTATLHAAAKTKSTAGGKWKTTASGKKFKYADGTYAKKVWLKLGGKYYYFEKDGKLAVKKMVTTGKKTYFVDARGARVVKNWVGYKGKTYFFDGKGVRLQNIWMQRKGKFYYLGKDGAVVKSCWVGSYYVGKDGARLVNCVKNGYWLNAQGKKTVKVFKGKYIFVGDSRMVGMKAAVGNADTKYIAKVGEGYEWLKKSAGKTLRYYLDSNPKVKVVLALGINDYLGNTDNYIQYYKQLMKEYPKTEFYVLSANPVDEKKAAQHGMNRLITNKSIRAKFNNKMYVAFHLPIFINSSDYLLERGIESVDGIHYKPAVYVDLYQFIVNRIDPENGQTPETQD